jgi:hypothetical protein
MSSRGIKADEITSVIDQLTVEGVISISTGTTPSLMLDRSINSGKEVYSVIGSEAENG